MRFGLEVGREAGMGAEVERGWAGLVEAGLLEWVGGGGAKTREGPHS